VTKKLYNSQLRRLDTIIGDDDYLFKIYRCREEYIEMLKVRDPKPHYVAFTNSGPFYEWVLNTYGIKMIATEEGITGQFEVVDEKKYLLFQLKYSASNR